MIRVPAFPGAPRCSMSFEEIRRFVLADSAALAEGKISAPFDRARVQALVSTVRRRFAG
jgi:predicted TIM-barrel enzyme